MLNHKGPQTIETKRLILRKFREEDIESAYQNWVAEPEVSRYLTWPAHNSIEVTKEVIHRWINRYNETHYYHWAIVPKSYGKVIGAITVSGVSERQRRAEVGYCIGNKFWSKGYMTEALRAVNHYMLFDINLNRIQAFYHPDNVASGIVMRKAYMKYEGRLRQYSKDNYGGISDKEVCSVLYEDIFNKNTVKHFIDYNTLTDGVIDLVCEGQIPENPEKDHVPYYKFLIKHHRSKKILGVLHFRLGFNEGIYYCGHLGYLIDDNEQNKGYATRACLLVKQVAKKHNYSQLIITTNIDNIASKKVCEKIGAKLIRVVKVPHKFEFYKEGPVKCIFQWSI